MQVDMNPRLAYMNARHEDIDTGQLDTGDRHADINKMDTV